MPIRASEKTRYPKDWPLSASLDDVLGDEVMAACDSIAGALGYDPIFSPHLWESWVGVVTGGDVTPHKHGCDILIEGAREYRIEVKYSRAFSIAFANGRRRCFKWLLTRPQVRRVGMIDAVVMIGVDNGRVGAWCAPAARLGRSITVTAPTDRRQSSHVHSFDRWVVPPLDLLPAILRTCHLSYDAKHHARNAAETRRKARALGDLFGGGGG